MAVDLSVLLPYRNAAATLHEALESVLSQRGPSFEVIAVDDGSTDASAEIVAQAARADRRIVPLATSEDRRGLVAALDLAARHSLAPLLARMDADDISLPGRFARQVEELERDPTLAVVGTCVRAFPAERVGEGLSRYVEWQNELITPEDHARDLFVESPLCHPSTVIRRAAYEAVGGYREHGWWEDYDLWLRLWASGARMAKVPEVLLLWRHSTGRMTLTSPCAEPERIRAQKARYLAPWLKAQKRPVAVWGAGPTGRRFARALAARGVVAARFIDIDPKKIGKKSRGVPIVSPDALRPGTDTVVVAVGARGARGLIRTHLLEHGFRETEDFVCTA